MEQVAQVAVHMLHRESWEELYKVKCRYIERGSISKKINEKKKRMITVKMAIILFFLRHVPAGVYFRRKIYL